MKWLDSRIHKPTCNAVDKYTTVVLLTEGVVTLGRSTWMPKDNYTDGEWAEFENTNGNKHGSLPVLFWQEHPSIPKIINNRRLP